MEKKTRGCPCGSKFSRCTIVNGRGVIICNCGRVLSDDAICGPEDLGYKMKSAHWAKMDREMRLEYCRKGGNATALQRKK